MQDFLYEVEMRALETEGVTKLVCAFSREPGKQAIAANGDATWDLLQKAARVFVCGEASRMAPDVKQASSAFSASTRVPPPPRQGVAAGLVTSHR